MKKLILGAAIASAFGIAQAATLPKATEIYSKMGFGINIGNTMEVPNDPTLWGNPYPTQQYIDSLKAAGFSTIRIPCAWDSHASNGTINTSWMDSVQTVVNMVLSTGAYAILNIHWDGGWFEDNLESYSSDIDTKLKSYWSQIATRFKDYNERLIFAGANEPGQNDSWTWDSDHVKVLNQYYTSFISTVRNSSGNNGTRTLIVQSPNADIEVAHSVYSGNMPSDPAGTGYLMFEPHFYPYNWALMESDADWGTAYYYWGPENYQSDDQTHNTGYSSNGYYHWCDSTYIDSVFTFMQQDFVNKGYPVVIGEFGSIKRISTLSSNSTHLEAHYKSRGRYYGYVAKSAKAHGIVPVAWDTGDEGDKNMTIIHRQSKFNGVDGSVVDTYVLNGMRNAYGLGNYSNTGITHVNDYITDGTSSSSIESSSSVQSSSSSSSSDVAGSSSSSSATSSSSRCNAMTPECGYTEDELCAYGITSYCSQGIRKELLSGSNALQFSDGTIRSSKDIRLFYVNGGLVKLARSKNGMASISTQGMKPGAYIAKSADQSLVIHIK